MALNFVPRRGAFIPPNPKFKSLPPVQYVMLIHIFRITLCGHCLFCLAFFPLFPLNKNEEIRVYFYCQVLHFFCDWVSIKNFVTRMIMGISQCKDILRMLKLIRNCAVILMLLLTSVFVTKECLVR